MLRSGAQRRAIGDTVVEPQLVTFGHTQFVADRYFDSHGFAYGQAQCVAVGNGHLDGYFVSDNTDDHAV